MTINDNHCYFTRPGFIPIRFAKMAVQSIAFCVVHLAMVSLFFTSFFILSYSTVPVRHNHVSPEVGGGNGSEKNSLKDNRHEALLRSQRWPREAEEGTWHLSSDHHVPNTVVSHFFFRLRHHGDRMIWVLSMCLFYRWGSEVSGKWNTRWVHVARKG